MRASGKRWNQPVTHKTQPASRKVTTDGPMVNRWTDCKTGKVGIVCGRFYIAEEDKAEELQRIIDLMNRKYNGSSGAKARDEVQRRLLG